MVLTATTTLSAPEVLARAKSFFAERVPHNAAFPEHEGPNHLVLRGQGGEEIALAILPGGSSDSRVIRISTLLFEQAIRRFLSTVSSGTVAP